MSYSNCNTVFKETPNFNVTLLKDRLGEINLIKRGGTAQSQRLLGHGLEDRRPGIEIPTGIFLFSAATDRTWGPVNLLFCGTGEVFPRDKTTHT